jgi:hypothetical protein
MNKQFETGGLVEHQVGVHVGRRNLLKLTGVGVAVLSMMSVSAPAFAQGTLASDKTFPKSERVDHRKVSFYNRLGITLVADLYVPKNIDRSRRHAALVKHAYSRASELKELFIVPGAGHVDLYDRVNLIPWGKLQSFFDKHLPERRWNRRIGERLVFERRNGAARWIRAKQDASQERWHS